MADTIQVSSTSEYIMGYSGERVQHLSERSMWVDNNHPEGLIVTYCT